MPTYCNELVVGGQVKFSLKDDTVTDPSHIVAGYYGHLADGRRVLGTGQGGPSATQHTIEFEFTDGTSTTLTGYWDGAFVTSAITATTPTEYGGKTVDSASLDGTAWYTRPAGTWVVLYTNPTVSFYPNPPEEGGSYCWIGSMGDAPFVVGDSYRITFDGTSYEVVAYNDPSYGPTIGQMDGSEGPISITVMYGAWVGSIEPNIESHHSLTVEHLELD